MVFSRRALRGFHTSDLRFGERPSPAVSTMAAYALIQNLRACWRKFAAAKGGNVVLTFALTAVPVFGLVGAAVDYSRANSAKAAMQAAVDATALMLSKEASTLTTAQMSQKATDYFYALFNRTEVTNVTITPTYTTTDSTELVLTGTGRVPTTLAKVLGIQQLNIGVSSTIRWGNTRLRVALVLDNTGSMSGSNKMTSLKTAAKSLLTQLRNAATQNGDVYVSIIPFSKDVLDHSVQQGRQCRQGQPQSILAPMGSLGRDQR
jgi:Flp pilus assembly protein TadG